jgi:calcium permeable stress-gated cation channel
MADQHFSSISRSQQSRYWAHLICAYILTFFTLYLIRREWFIFIHNRHEFLLSQQHSKLAQAKTVLITNVPVELAGSEKDLKQFFSFVPGGIARVWIYRSCPGLPDLFEERLKACQKLEVAATDVMQLAVKAARKARPQAASSHGPSLPLAVHANKDDRALAAAAEQGNIGAGRFLDNITRPTHRLGWIPFIGQKVDTIDWCTKEIARLNIEIDKLRETLPDCPPQGSAFVQCNLQMGAHVLAQCAAYHEPLYMAQRWIEVAPEDVIWANVSRPPFSRTFFPLTKPLD